MTSRCAVGAEPPQVAPHLMPVRAFDAACALVIEHMARVAPLGV